MGRLNQIIEVQRKEVQRDPFGSSVETWVTLATVWAERLTWKPKQKFVQGSNRFANISTSSFKIHQRADLDETMRVIDDHGAEWNILGLNKEDRQFLTLQVGHLA